MFGFLGLILVLILFIVLFFVGFVLNLIRRILGLGLRNRPGASEMNTKESVKYKKKKLFDKQEGEYVDFEEVK